MTPQKGGGYTTPASALDLTTSLRGDLLFLTVQNCLFHHFAFDCGCKPWAGPQWGPGNREGGFCPPPPPPTRCQVLVASARHPPPLTCTRLALQVWRTRQAWGPGAPTSGLPLSLRARWHAWCTAHTHTHTHTHPCTSPPQPPPPPPRGGFLVKVGSPQGDSRVTQAAPAQIALP